MSKIAKYLKKIDDSLEILMRNSDLVKEANENLAIINKLEDQIKKNKNIKIETIELINQIIIEIEKINSDSMNKRK
ncbi:MAG: hypothetical protein CFH34_00606 [Alphaproteobacteria bacterium MarineAlpha9_Bin4]|nr:hypothetical protein [Pelagibacterales bacterium]PPR26973.1 MAG: hypothetical protein CFH34_00606 [Alphaproteobacteria bacterium MarineAlpha9_Bin4]|tara:strand:- start:493 stop:720 length:228 start_codon:yes stop_codon:yes gene_type:complete